MISSSVETTTQSQNEIIFPQGDFRSDEPPLETYQHLQQIILLLTSLEWLWREREDYFAAGNLTIYYSPVQQKSTDFRGPDFFVVLGTERRLDRKSWVVWEEGGRYPDLIVEILSESTAKIDKGQKKQIYQDIFRTPDYFWFDPESLELAGFRLVEGEYQPIEANSEGRLWSSRLELYLGIYQEKLRYFTPTGELVPTPEETAQLAQKQREEERVARELAQQQREEERLARELAQQQIEELKAQLRALGIDPE